MSVTHSLRVALLLDPLSVSLDHSLNLRVKWGNHAPQLARELLGRGHTVRGFGAPPGLIPRSSELEFEAHETRGVLSRLQAFQPNVLLSYDALSPAAMRGARMARKLDAPLVLVESALPGGGRWHERMLYKVGEWMWGPYVRKTASAVVALDTLAKRQALSEGFDASRVCIVPHGVDTSVFRPGLASTLVARHRIRGRILLYVGLLDEARGLEVLISAFSRTVGQRSDWNLVLAGEGQAKPQLRAMVGRLGIDDRVHWLTWPRREELPGLMGASTLLAVPARDDTVVGRQLGRALACGLPVIASDLPRLRGLTEHEENGLLAPAGDVEAWTQALRQAASSPVARKRWSANARRRAEESLSWASVASAFEDIFLQARDRAPQGGAEPAGEPEPRTES
jgi:glycosyltransferase involved in cell wall biosynthesis